MISKPNSKYIDLIKCSVCQADIIDFSHVYQTPATLGLLCNECKSRFSSEDVDMMINLFLAFGGYFGRDKCKEFNLLKMINKKLKGAHIHGKNIIPSKMSVMLMYQSLLHGITPQSHIKQLKGILHDIL